MYKHWQKPGLMWAFQYRTHVEYIIELIFITIYAKFKKTEENLFKGSMNTIMCNKFKVILIVNKVRILFA